MSAAELRRRLATGERHVSPFLMLGDPSPGACVQLCRALVDAGARMLELGIPYADPSADGPAVQAAGRRALQAGVSTDVALQTLRDVRDACPTTPCNLLVYGNLVHARGYDRFCRDAVLAGASSLLVPDIPLEEGSDLRAACVEHDLGVVLLAGPRTPPARLEEIDESADAFVYLAGHQGITGAQKSSDDRRRALVARVREIVQSPLCVGFGLGAREHVATVHDAGAQLAVVGSHLLRVLAHALERHEGDGRQVLCDVTQAFQQLIPTENPKCS
ncbi:MAG: tryptophan synthase subunit alpha [Planctomycetota bacterium]|nr:tryptophan synthase subunit alpha [Planctomycetota bacterium]